MMKAATPYSSGGFKTSLKTNPRLHYVSFKDEVITYASNQCNEYTGDTGLLGYLLPAAQWAAFPGNRTVVAGVVVIAPIYDIATAIDPPANNASNATVKIYEMAINKRIAVKRGIQTLKAFMIEITPDSDLSELKDTEYAMTSVTPAQIYAHLGVYSVLEQKDYDLIDDRLNLPKSATEDYKTLAETHRDLHALLASSGQPKNQKEKTALFMKALETDYAGHEACREFIRAHPLVATRNFVDLVATVLLHAPSIVPTTSALGYSNAQTTISVASALVAPTTEAELVAHIAECQRKVSAMRRTSGAPASAPKTVNPVAGGGGPLKYCYKHGYQKSHIGADCFVLKKDTQLYAAQHLAATDHNNPPGGNPVRKG